jgi:hypothetical protein
VVGATAVGAAVGARVAIGASNCVREATVKEQLASLSDLKLQGQAWELVWEKKSGPKWVLKQELQKLLGRSQALVSTQQ